MRWPDGSSPPSISQAGLLCSDSFPVMDWEVSFCAAPVQETFSAAGAGTLLEKTMTLTIDLKPELEQRLREIAMQQGLLAEEYVRRLIERHLPVKETSRPSLWDTLTPEEWIRETTAWAQSHDYLHSALAG